MTMGYEDFLPILAVGALGAVVVATGSGAQAECTTSPGGTCAPSCYTANTPIDDSVLAALCLKYFPANAQTMFAIAIAESTGYPTNYNCSCCYGLWQIGSVHLGEYNGLPSSDPSVLFNPDTNAQYAVQVLAQQGLSGGWQSYSNGSYAQYLGRAAQAIAALASAPATPLVYNAPSLNLCAGCEVCVTDAGTYSCCEGDGAFVEDDLGNFIGCCAAGGSYDYGTQTCITPIQNGICPSGYAPDPTNSYCIAVSTNDVTSLTTICAAGYIYDEVSDTCLAVTTPQCGAGLVWDVVTGNCQPLS